MMKADWTRTAKRTLWGAAAATVLLALAGCGGSSSTPAPVEIKGSAPQPARTKNPAPVSTAPLTTPDARGIIAYEGYEAAVAREGDTVASVAARLGLSASELGAYNGLAPDYPLRPGDELVLPPRPDRYGVGVASTAPATDLGAPPDSPADAAGAGTGSQVEALPLDGAAATAGSAPATAAGDKEASGGAPEWNPDIVIAAIERAQADQTENALAPPPSADEPLPPAPAAPRPLASPHLDQYQTVPPGAPATGAPVASPAAPPPTVAPGTAPAPPAVPTAPPPAEDTARVASTTDQPALRLIRPVQGPIVVGYYQGVNRVRNEGVDFAAPANSPVVAAADGEVVLVSPALGGLGTIVLIRHQGDYLTVYGRIEKVRVKKGDKVRQGQQIGVVSPAIKPRMHFEVRKGTESLDPEKFFV